MYRNNRTIAKIIKLLPVFFLAWLDAYPPPTSKTNHQHVVGFSDKSDPPLPRQISSSSLLACSTDSFKSFFCENLAARHSTSFTQPNEVLLRLTVVGVASRGIFLCIHINTRDLLIPTSSFPNYNLLDFFLPILILSSYSIFFKIKNKNSINYIIWQYYNRN